MGGFAVIAALLVVLVGVAGYGPLHGLRRKEAAAATSRSGTTLGRGTDRSTTTTFTLERRTYNVGDCVVWDQKHSRDTRGTRVVPCAEPHLMEVSAKVELSSDDDAFPTPGEWALIFTDRCTASVAALIGAPFDPQGRFAVAGLQPSHDGWGEGDRTVWCAAVSVTGDVRAGTYALFTGKVEGADQTRLEPVGACTGGLELFVVPCARSHVFEVTGHLTLAESPRPPAPRDDRAWLAYVGDRCEPVARAYLGRDLRADEHAGFFEIERQSWDAGRRKLECTVARYAGDKTLRVTGSLKG